jgi:hypothetical protein
MPDNNSEDKKPLTRPYISPTKIVSQQEKWHPIKLSVIAARRHSKWRDNI